MTGDASPNLQPWAEASFSILSGMTAAEKATAVREMERRGEPVLFVGDGLNDAEAMAAATASLAVTGLLHPVAAAAIMFASSLTVVALAGRHALSQAHHLSARPTAFCKPAQVKRGTSAGLGNAVP